MEIYLEVYKLHRLPSSPPGKLAIWEEIMAKVLDNSCSKEDQMHEATTQPWLESSHSSRSRTPHRGDDDPVGQTLATVLRSTSEGAIHCLHFRERKLRGSTACSSPISIENKV